MKTKSNRYKRRNLPEDYSVIHSVKTKPVFAMFVFLLIGGIMVFSTNYKLIGAVFAFIGGYTLFVEKDKVSIEFSNDFMVVYLEDNEEDCFLIYYKDVETYNYCARMYQTDYIQIITKDKKLFEFKCLDRRKIKKYLKEHLVVKTENDKK